VTHIKVRGFKIYKDRLGKRRCYHRKTGIAVDLAKNPFGSPGFFAECARIAAIEQAQIGRPGTLRGLVNLYRKHMNFTDLATRTRWDYDKIFEYLNSVGDTPLIRFRAPLVVAIRDKAAEQKGRRFGNYVKSVLSVVFAWGVERGHLETNPAAKIKSIRKPRNAPDVNRPWSDAERHAVLEAAPFHIRLPIALMMFTGMDPQDALTLEKTALDKDTVSLRRRKTGVPVQMPIISDLRDVLDQIPDHYASKVCVTSQGGAWSAGGFRASWRKVKNDLEKEGRVQPGLTLKGLRTTAATILAETEDVDYEAIADFLGHKTLAMAKQYARQADRSRRIANTAKKFDREIDRRRGLEKDELSNSSEKVSNCPDSTEP